MGYKIFLDDERFPDWIYKTDNNDWVILRDLDEFKKYIETHGIPDFISFDNDLGKFPDETPKPEGVDAVKWIVFEKELDISNMDFKVHSANTARQGYIQSTMTNWKNELLKRKEEMDKNQIRKEVRKILVATNAPILSAALSHLKEAEIPGEIRLKFHIPVPEDIMNIKNLLKNKGHKLFVVGGAVRDALLKKIPKDFDLATDALPDSIQAILHPFYKTLEVGKDFGVINVLTPTGEYEIATFRKDIGKGRRPDAVEFTTIDQDVKRRDLTINALFYDIDTEEVVDLVGGIEDLKNGVVRTVGSAEERFDEDKLRILRAIRFTGRFGSDLDPAVDAALRKDSDLSHISGERIRDEFIKGIKSAKSVKHFLELLQRYNLFQWIFGPLLVKEKGMQSLDLIEERDVPVLLAYLLIDNNVDVIKKELNNLKYSTDEVAQISFLVSFSKFTPEEVFKFKKAQANSKLSDEQIRKFAQWMRMDMKLIDAFLKFKTTVTGQELIAQGFTGKALGAEMEKREIQNFLSSL